MKKKLLIFVFCLSVLLSLLFLPMNKIAWMNCLRWSNRITDKKENKKTANPDNRFAVFYRLGNRS